jgi:hypothetical protein
VVKIHQALGHKCDRAFRELKNVKFVKYYLTENGLKDTNWTVMVQE